jgi:hypothetical protein
MIVRATSLLVLVLSCLPVGAQPATQPAMIVDKEKKTIIIPAAIAPRKLAYLTEIYPIEVIACWPHPRGKKAHETVVTFDVKPSDVHKALESFGLKPGQTAKGEDDAGQGPEVKVYLEFPGPDGAVRREPIEKTVVDKKTGKNMPALKWYFTGSVMTQPNPEKDEKVYGADLTGSLICVFPVTNQVVIQTNLVFKDQGLLRLETNKKLLPAEGTAVKLIIEAK